MHARVGVLIALVGSGVSWANQGGITGASGENPLNTCVRCHTGAPPPSIIVDGLVGPAADGAFTPGETAALTIRVRRANGSPGTRAGFNAATDSAGVFSGADAATIGRADTFDNQATHRAPRAYDANGEAAWTVSLGALQEGRHRLFVGANDADGDGNFAGDRGGTAVFALLVCAADDADDDAVTGACDDCPTVANPDQADRDEDGTGDACDVCPDVDDPAQTDLDEDGAGDACDDVTDECALDLHDCAVDAACIDEPFLGFACACLPGFDGDGRTCVDVDECDAGLDDCDDALATCANTPGSYACACIEGYAGDGVVCVDVDECAADLDECAADAKCTNAPGGFSCACLPGFDGDGRTCVDIDECEAELDVCDDALASCTNTLGAYACACIDGYAGDGVVCVDVDECAADLDDCDDALATCTNTPGGFRCSCPASAPGDGRTCVPTPSSCACATVDDAPAALALALLVLGRWRRRR